MGTIGDGPFNLRAHYTQLAAQYLAEHKRPGEPVGVAVEPAKCSQAPEFGSPEPPG